MATGNTVSDSGLRPQLWSKELWNNVIDSLFFTQNKLMGEDKNNIVYVMNDLKEKVGDRITVPITYKLSGSGITGDNEAEGNEEKIVAYSDAVLIDQIRKPVRLTGLLDEQKNAYNMRVDAKEKIAIWMKEFIERQIFFKLGGVNNTSLNDVNATVVAAQCNWSNTSDEVPDADTAAGYGYRYLCADSTSGATSLAATDLITPALLSRLRAKASNATPSILPIQWEGDEYYVVFVHPNQMYDLKQNPVFTQALREAERRGKDNPLFKHAQAYWDGMIIYEHKYVPFLDISVAGHNFSSSSAGTDYAAVDAYRAILCGRQAAVLARCKTDTGWVEKKFDYDNQAGFSSSMIGGIQKVTFNSLDYATVCLDTAATAI